MAVSHALDGWLASHDTRLRAGGITAVAARAPAFLGRPSATWISFETGRSTGRAVLWSSGRCELNARATDGRSLCAEERTITTSAELADALGMLTDQLSAVPSH